MTFEYNITYRKKDGGWQYIISFKDETDKWRQRSKQGFNTKTLAKIAADKRLDELKENHKLQRKVSPELEGITFLELSEMYLKHKALYAEPASIIGAKSALNHFTTILAMPVRDIISLHIQEAVDEMVRKGYAANSVETYLMHVRLIFDYAINPHQIIATNPTKDIKVPKHKRQNNKDVKALTSYELKDLLSRINNPKYYVASVLASKCGLRIGEIIGLTWDRVDFERASITIDRQWKLIGINKYGYGSPKSENSYRDVPVPNVVLEALLQYKKQYPVHISNRILPYANTNCVATSLSNHYAKIGFENVTIHDLRHTYATLLVFAGVDFKTIAGFMGHDVDQTIKTYSHLTSEMRDSATNIINNIF